jgi:hypothetical protein
MHENNPSASKNKILTLLKKWGWIIVLELVLMVLFFNDKIPQLRGYKPWPPEWQWRFDPGTNQGALLPMMVFGILIAVVGWYIDQVKEKWKKGILIGGLVVFSCLWMYQAVRVRGHDTGLFVAQRTSVYFIEDFFKSAQVINMPIEAFTRYQELADQPGQLRVATHPPGLIFVYALFQKVGGPGPLERFCGRYFGGETYASEYSPDDRVALLYASLFKLVVGMLFLWGVWLIVRALYDHEPVHLEGKAMAVAVLIPGITMFTFTLDQLIMGFSTVTVGAMMMSMRSERFPLWAALGGVAIFCQSCLAYQAATTGFIATVAICLYGWRYVDNWKTFGRLMGPRMAIFVMVPLMCWVMIQSATGFNYFTEFFKGLSMHTDGAIHEYRTHWAWVIWNQWDVIFFFGLAFFPLWISKTTWKPFGKGNPVLYGVLASWVLIHLMDGIRGETARLILYYFPLLAAALLANNYWVAKKENYFPLAGLLILQSLVFAAVLNVF